MRIVTFKGVVPKLRSEKLGPDFAVEAENCLLHSGAVVPLRAAEPIGQVVGIDGQVLTTAPKSLYHVGPLYLGFTAFTSIAEDPLRIGGIDSFLYVEDGLLYRSSAAWVTDKQGPVRVGINAPCDPLLASQVEAECPSFDFGIAECDLGIPRPDIVCDNQIPPQTLSFCYTYLTECGEESSPSPYAEPIQVDAGKSVLLAVTETPPNNAVSIRWYMSVVDKQDALMLVVGETTLPTMTLLFCPDEFAGDEALVSEGWQPISCAQGVANIGQQRALVWSGRNLYPSVPRQPHAYMETDRLKLDYDIVRVVSYLTDDGGYTAVALTTGTPYIITEQDDYLVRAIPLSRDMPLVSQQGVTLIGRDIFYCSNEGIAILSGKSVNLFTPNWLDTHNWTAMGPKNYVLGYHDQRLLCMSTSRDSRSFMLTTPRGDTGYERQDMVYLSTRVTALCDGDTTAVKVTGLSQGSGTVYAWEAGAQNMLATWQSKTFTTTGRWHPTACKVLTDTIRVHAEAWPWLRALSEELGRRPTAAEALDFIKCHKEAAPWVNELVGGYTHFYMYAGKELMFQREVWNQWPFRVKRNRNLVEWGFAVKTTEPVYEIHLQTSMEDLTQEGGHA